MSAWREATTPDGRIYYWHTKTKETVWNKPDDFGSPKQDPAAVDGVWNETKAPDGSLYYWHSITRETRRTPPEGYLKQEPARIAAAAPDFVAGGALGFGGGDRHGGVSERRMERRDDRDHHLPQKPSFDGGRGGGGVPWENRQDNTGFRGPMPVKTDEPEYATAEQAEEAFFKLLKSHEITPDTAWEDALRLVIRDREYRALKDPKERRQTYDKYCQQVRAEEKGKEKERRERLREDFRKMLTTHEDIKHYTRWTSARPLIEREAVYKSAGDEDERRQMFDDYIVELRKKHAEDEVVQRKIAKQELDVLLKALIIDPDTPWNDAREVIKGSERFIEDDAFRAISDADLLHGFDTHIKALDRERNDAKQTEKRLRVRRERQARQAFQELLRLHLKESHIKAGSKWKDFLPLVAEDERYMNLIGTPGSSPLDLFWDVVEEEEQKLRSKRNHALDVLEDQQYEMNLETTLDDFARVMTTDPRTADLGTEMLAMIYERLMAKIRARIEHDKVEAEKQQRKAIDALRSIIKRMEPPVRVSDKYEDIVPRLVDFEEYQLLDNEEARRAAFDKHMRRLREKDADDAERERVRRDRDREREHRNGSRRDDRERDRGRKTRTPEVDAYEADRRKAQADRERQYRKASFGLTPPRERERDRYDREGGTRRHTESVYDRERREREMERERNYVSRADPRDKGRTLDYGDEDAAPGSGSRPGSIRKRRDSQESVGSKRDVKRARRGKTKTPEPETMLKEEPPALQSGSEEGEIEEI